MASPFERHKKPSEQIRRSVCINTVNAASEVDLTVPTPPLILGMPSRRSTRKLTNILEHEENSVLPLQSPAFFVGSANNILKQNVPKRKRDRKMKAIVDECVVEKFLHAVTDEDRREWKGWCELESEPVCLCFPMLEKLPVCSFIV